MDSSTVEFVLDVDIDAVNILTKFCLFCLFE